MEYHTLSTSTTSGRRQGFCAGKGAAVAPIVLTALIVAALTYRPGHDAVGHSSPTNSLTRTGGSPAGLPAVHNSAYRLTINSTSGGEVYVGGLSLLGNRASSVFTANLAMPEGNAPAPGHLTATQVIYGGQLHQPRPADPAQAWTTTPRGDGVTVVSPVLEVGPQGSPVAEEVWTITLEGRELRWEVARTWKEDVEVESDRLVMSLLTVGHPPVYGSQVPGLMDTEMELNGTAGYYVGPANDKDQCYASTYDTGRPCIYEALFPSNTAVFHLAPANIRLCSSLRGPAHARHSYSKAWADGTSSLASIGAQAVDRQRGPVSHRAGTESTLEWRMILAADDDETCSPTPGEFPPDFAGDFAVSLPGAQADVRTAVRAFVQTQNQWLGYVYGNNPASVTCLHEMGFFGWIQGMMSTGDGRVFKALQQEIEMFANSVAANGYVMPRWGAKGFYFVPWGPLADQIPHYVIAVHALTVSTGDRAWLRSILPALTRVLGHITASLDPSGVYISGPSYHPDGTPHQPASTGRADGEHHASNWFDVVEFGHLDANNAAYALVALQCAADLHGFLGMTEEAAAYDAAFARGREGYNRAFWDESAGHYVDWVDVDGGVHSHLYVNHNFLAVMFGIASPAQARSIIRAVDGSYEEVYRRKDVRPGKDVFSTPCNLKPLTMRCEAVDKHRPAQPCSNTDPPYDPWGNYPSYENGQAFFHSVGLEAAARAAVADRAGAWAVFERLILHGVKDNRGWAQGALFKDLLGFDPLNCSILAVWGMLRGLMRVVPTLRHGVLLNDDSPFPAGEVVPEMEGARWTFAYLGDDFCVEMRNGQSIPCS